MSTLKEAVTSDQSLDVRGMGCPMPLIKAINPNAAAAG